MSSSTISSDGSRPLRARRYACLFAAAAGVLFLCVVGANVIIDPQGVFGTGILEAPLNPNTRYLSFAEYEAAPSKYDGVLFASSRGNGLPLDELSQRMHGTSFANFSVSLGLLTDHLPFLEYILRDKAARKERLRAVFLLLDVDGFGDRPMTNRSIQMQLPPAVTGDRPIRFWWQYLTAFQPKAWENELSRAWRSRTAAGSAFDLLGQLMPAARADGLGSPQRQRPPQMQLAQLQVPDAPTAGATVPVGTPGRITTRPDYARQRRLLGQFVRLCRENNVELVVATAPLSPSEYGKHRPEDLAEVIDDLSRIVPVWDFSTSPWPAAHIEFWVDLTHFTHDLGRIMLDRMFGDTAASAPPDFGRLHRS